MGLLESAQIKYAQGQKDLEALTEKARLLEAASQEIDSLTAKHEKAVAARDAKGKRWHDRAPPQIWRRLL